MKKFLKYFLISLATFLLLFVIAVSVALWFVFTPEKLTPAVRNQVMKYINCQNEIGKIELIFFSSFPRFGLKADRLILINPVDGAPCDTLIKVDEIIGIINILSLIRDKELIVNEFRLSNGSIRAFVDSQGNSNFNIFPTDTIDSQTYNVQSDMMLKVIDVNNLDLKNIDVSYLDQSMNLKADVQNLTATISGSMESGNITGNLDAKPFDISFGYMQADESELKAEIRNLSTKMNGSMNNGEITGNLDAFSFESFSADVAELKTEIQNFSAKLYGIMKSGNIRGTADISPFDITLKYNTIETEIENFSVKIDCVTDLNEFSGDIFIFPFGITYENGNEKYLQNAKIKLNIIGDANLSRQSVNIKEASISLNGLELDMSGTVENDTINKCINTNISYNFSSWLIKKLIDLVPPSMTSYLQGIDVDGLLSSEGIIEGKYSQSSFPMANIRLRLDNGTLNYDDFPLPLSDINADLTIRTDLKNPQSYVRINRFDAKTPQSSIMTAGTLNNLFTDIRAEMNTDFKASIPEFAPFIPDSLNITAKGLLSGNINSDFTMSQLAEMQIEKMKFSGSLALSDFAMIYDSLSLKTDRSSFDFALPNQNPSTATTGFVFANIRANSLETSKINSFDVSLQNTEIILEASDVRDTTRMPNIVCLFKFTDLNANTDSIRISIAAPVGKISLAPRRDNPKHPIIDLSYNSGRIHADFDENTIIIEKLELGAGVVNDPEKNHVVAQWSPRGSIDMTQGKIMLSAFPYPVDITAVKMNFEMESFAIERGSVKLDNSDFNLSGRLENISSWFRGDSLLRGNFDFNSEMTDIVQIMNLTNGIGHSEEEKEDIIGSSSTFLVPKGIELTLNTNIRRAAYGKEITADNIRGQVHVRDGTLLLDELTFTTPATDMELSALYRTPRKDHLLVWLNLKMLNIEIAELLQMVPAVDSIMPMLRSFGGKGEFRFAGQLNTDSMYNVKMSTIRGSSSIRGADLVLMDGETFSRIARSLRFKKQTENKVDSLSAEFSILRRRVTVYPFLIVMDRYKAVVGGQHFLDMSFDYNISLVESPLPIRLAVDVRGTPEKLKFKWLRRSKFPDFYRPASRREIESEELNLRNLIRRALLGNEEINED